MTNNASADLVETSPGVGPQDAEEPGCDAESTTKDRWFSQ
jgi:hypothetical protein